MKVQRAVIWLAVVALLGALIVTLSTRSRALGSESTRVSNEPSASSPRLSGAPALAPELNPSDLRSKPFENVASYIPAQCYTKTQDARGGTHNPCFTCHSGGGEPNYAADGELQLGFDFPEPALTNPWQNLFVDRGPAIRATSDEAVLGYVRRSNYFDESGKLSLAERLLHLPEQWDFDGDGRYSGYVPDAYFSFDAEGFDHDPSGVESGWRAYAYYPFPGTFWPTNGSAGDALIRLPTAYRELAPGQYDRETYIVNLAIVEALVKRKDVAIARVDEHRFGVDLDKNGVLGRATNIRYDWAPRAGREMSFVGQARIEGERAGVKPAAGLFPTGTELLHSVHYLDVVPSADHAGSRVTMAARLKELRYARKTGYRNYAQLGMTAQGEAREKQRSPERLHQVRGDLEQGVENGQGWRYQGYIEDAQGELRPQTYTESKFCVACHGGVGATVDGTFSFARKLPSSALQQGWFHWSQHGLEGIVEPRRSDGRPEYAYYLEQNGAGDEMRSNAEVDARFFDAEGKAKPLELARLGQDISRLLLPSPERALALDKAYWSVVREQSYARGRDAPLSPAQNVHRVLRPDTKTGISHAITSNGLR